VDNVDNWTQGTNLHLGNIRIHISVSKTVDIVDNWTQRTNLKLKTLIHISVSKTANIVDNWTLRTNLNLVNNNPYQCVKNCGHCGQLDARDKSITTEH
jgi:hypothetical protein